MSVNMSNAVSILNNAAPLVRAAKLATAIKQKQAEGKLSEEKAKSAAAEVFGVDDINVNSPEACIDGLIKQIDTSMLGDDASKVAETAKGIVSAIVGRDPSALPDNLAAEIDKAAKADAGTTKGIVNLIKNYKSVLGLSKADVDNFDIGG